MTPADRIEFLLQSIESHDRQFGDLTRQVNELTRSVNKLVTVRATKTLPLSERGGSVMD